MVTLKPRHYFGWQPDKRLIQVEIVELLTHVNIIKEKLDFVIILKYIKNIKKQTKQEKKKSLYIYPK